MAETFEQWWKEVGYETFCTAPTLEDAMRIAFNFNYSKVQEKDERIAELEAKYEGLRQIHQADSEASYHIDVAHLAEVNSLKAKIAKLGKVVEAGKRIYSATYEMEVSRASAALRDALAELEGE